MNDLKEYLMNLDKYELTLIVLVALSFILNLISFLRGS